MFGWFHSLLTNPRRSARILFWYWGFSALAFGLFTFVISTGSGTEVDSILGDPGAAFSFGYACLNLLMMGVLRYAQRDTDYLRIFSIFAIVQQLSCANIPGAFLAWTLWRAQPFAKDMTEPVHPGVFWAAVGGIGFVSAIFFFGQVSLLLS